MQFDLHHPIGVFDAGIGSYAIVQLIQRHHPRQDILYFADRASFPYGGKSHQQLADSMDAAIGTLARLGAQAVVLASNAPSVMVLDAIAPRQPVPVLGIYPPVAQALAASRSGVVAVLGVASLVQSAQIVQYVHSQSAGRRVELVNASALVQLVEDGSFLSDPGRTADAVAGFMQGLLQAHPGLDTCTLSSTHLPWLAPFFQRAAPDVAFLDPAEALLPRLAPHLHEGRGTTVCIATETPALPASELRQMLLRLGVALEPHVITTGPAG